MRKILALVFAFCMITLISEATLVKGSVPNNGEKRFTFTPDFSGTVLLHLIYENKTSDLDIQLGIRDSQSGDIQLVAISESTLQNFEQLDIGVLGGEQYSIFVVSSHGPSPFRLNFDGTFTTSSAAGAAGKLSIALKEAPIDAASRKFLDKMKARKTKR
jgi:hypothetical protein